MTILPFCMFRRFLFDYFYISLIYEWKPERRFLRARRFDVIKAQKQFLDRVSWEKKYDVPNMFANFPTDEFESSRRFYPRWTGRRDKVWLQRRDATVRVRPSSNAHNPPSLHRTASRYTYIA